MNDHATAIWRKRLRQAALLAGLGIAALGSNAGAAEAAVMLPAPLVAPAASAAIQPIYWARDRFGRQIWVEPRRYRPPPRHHYYRPPHHQRRGWVDRYGRWHPNRY
ncbi:MAG TPA: hypothetical protein VL154_10850 [Acetobacteraceae bacterium]|jgi:hypothetical protein|nr:hypothetical protein [Acetobacteraceae bacterium]